MSIIGVFFERWDCPLHIFILFRCVHPTGTEWALWFLKVEAKILNPFSEQPWKLVIFVPVVCTYSKNFLRHLVEHDEMNTFCIDHFFAIWIFWTVEKKRHMLTISRFCKKNDQKTQKNPKKGPKMPFLAKKWPKMTKI